MRGLGGWSVSALVVNILYLSSTAGYDEVPLGMNITGTYKGEWTLWKNKTENKVEGLTQATGTAFIQLKSGPTTDPEYHHVRGEVVIWDGEYSTTRDSRMSVRGIFHLESGMVALSSEGLSILAGDMPTLAENATRLQWLLEESKTSKALSREGTERIHEEDILKLGNGCGLQLSMKASPAPALSAPAEDEEFNESSSLKPPILAPIMGMIRSADCDFGLYVTAVGMELDKIYRKAIHYAFMASAVSVVQVTARPQTTPLLLLDSTLSLQSGDPHATTNRVHQYTVPCIEGLPA